MTAKDVEEAIERGIQRGIASVRNDGESFCIVKLLFIAIKNVC